MDATFAAVAAIAEEPVGLAAGARRCVVDVLGPDARALEHRARRDAQIDMLLLRALHDHARQLAERGAKLLDDFGPDLEALGTDGRAERDANVLGLAPELAQLTKQEQGTTIEIELTENGLLPRLDLALSFGPVGTSGPMDAKFSEAAKNLAKFNELGATGSLTFQQGLNRDDVRGREKEQRANREKVRVNAADVRLQIAQALTVAVAQIELAKRRVVLSQRAIDLAVENIRIETDRFNLGKSTNFDVLNRLEEQRQAELRKAQALIDWHKAETVVMALTGDILPAFGVSVE